MVQLAVDTQTRMYQYVWQLMPASDLIPTTLLKHGAGASSGSDAVTCIKCNVIDALQCVGMKQLLSPAAGCRQQTAGASWDAVGSTEEGSAEGIWSGMILRRSLHRSILLGRVGLLLCGAGPPLGLSTAGEASSPCIWTPTLTCRLQ
jgi:hypothetical protein